MDRLKRNNDRVKKLKKRRRRTILILSLIIILPLLVIGAIWLIKHFKAKDYTGYDVIATVEAKQDGITQYVPYPAGYVWYNGDGIEAVDSEGTKLWNVSYNMSEPIMATCENCAIVGDYGGTSAYIIDGTGSVNPVTLPYAIQEVEVANQGVAAIRMNDGTDDYIRIVDLSGELLVDIKTKELVDGFPIDIALSNDGTKLITSYMSSTEATPQYWVTFYNFTATGQSYVENVVGTFSYETIIPSVEFLNNDTACVYLENGFELYSMLELPQSIKLNTYNESILRVASDENNVAIVLNYSNNGNQSRVLVYDTKGTLLFDKEIAESYEAVLISGEDLLLYNHLSCVIWKLTGEKKINAAFNNAVYGIMPVNNKDKYILLREETIDTIQLTYDVEE